MELSPGLGPRGGISPFSPPPPLSASRDRDNTAVSRERHGMCQSPGSETGIERWRETEGARGHEGRGSESGRFRAPSERGRGRERGKGRDWGKKKKSLATQRDRQTATQRRDKSDRARSTASPAENQKIRTDSGRAALSGDPGLPRRGASQELPHPAPVVPGP